MRLTSFATVSGARRVPSQPDLAPIADALTELAKVRDPKTPEEETEQKARAEDAANELRSWLTSPHASIRTHAAAALETLGNPRQRPEVAAAAFPPADEALPTVPQRATLTFETTKGTFVVALDTQEAPLTSANLFGLAKKGYSDGIFSTGWFRTSWRKEAIREETGRAVPATRSAAR